MGVLWGKIGEGVVRYWPLTNSFFLLGVLTSVPILVKIDQEMRPWECSQTDRLTDWQTDTLTDANRFYNLSHAICYSYGTDKNSKRPPGHQCTTPHHTWSKSVTRLASQETKMAAGHALDEALRGMRGLAAGVGDKSVLLGFFVSTKIGSRRSTNSYSLSTGCIWDTHNNISTCTMSPRPTQPSIPPGSVNEYQLWLGRQRQVWFIPLADECWVCR